MTQFYDVTVSDDNKQKIQTYERFASGLLRPDLVMSKVRLTHYLGLKLFCETGELLGELAKHLYHAKPLEECREKIILEAGD